MKNLTATSEENAVASEEVSASTEETAASMNQVASAAQNIAEMSRKLSGLVSRFKVDIPGITYRCKADKNWTMIYVSDAIIPIRDIQLVILSTTRSELSKCNTSARFRFS